MYQEWIIWCMCVHMAEPRWGRVVEIEEMWEQQRKREKMSVRVHRWSSLYVRKDTIPPFAKLSLLPWSLSPIIRIDYVA